MVAFLVIIAAALALGWALSNAEECPRQILGYRCKGDACDHSKIEVMRAKNANRKGDKWL